MQHLTKEALRIELWSMLTNDAKEAMKAVKETYLDSLMADIDDYADGKQQPNVSAMSLQFGYVCKIDEESRFIIAENISDCMDKMQILYPGKKHSMGSHASIPVILSSSPVPVPVVEEKERNCDAMGHYGGSYPDGICEKCNKPWNASTPPVKAVSERKQEWKLVGHNHQIADTGDYDGCYELTNGKISIYTKDDDDDSLKEIAVFLNRYDIDFFLDDSDKELNFYLNMQLDELRKQLNPQPDGVEAPAAPGIDVEKAEGINAGRELVTLINRLNAPMVEQFQRHDYRSMYEIWGMIIEQVKNTPVRNYERAEQVYSDLRIAGVLPSMDAVNKRLVIEAIEHYAFTAPQNQPAKEG